MKNSTIYQSLVVVFVVISLSACSSATQAPALDPTQGAQLLAGRYITTITSTDVQKANSLDPTISSNQGDWALELTNDGKFTANLNGQFVASGSYTVNGQAIKIYVNNVCQDCGCDQGIGKYIWAMKDSQLSFVKTAGICDAMDLLLTSHPLTKSQ